MNEDDLIRIIQVETGDLAEGVDQSMPGRWHAAKAAATILWAASSLLDQLEPAAVTAPRVVARNGVLIDRYTGRGDA